MSDQESPPPNLPPGAPRYPFEGPESFPSTSRAQSSFEDYRIQIEGLPKAGIVETVSLLLAVWLFDWTLYGRAGFASVAVLFVGLTLLFWTGVRERKQLRISIILSILIVILAARMVWEGDPLGVLLGWTLLVALSVSLSGNLPYVIESSLGTAANLLAGIAVLPSYVGDLRKSKRLSDSATVVVFVPLFFLLVFAALFVLANPVMREWVHSVIERFLNLFSDSPVTMVRILFWGLASWIFAGFVRGEMLTGAVRQADGVAETLTKQAFPTTSAPDYAYPLARNTLVSVVVLFLAYLSFEITYIWSREIPEGFYYSGYAHEGAMWLTVALAFSTLTLGTIFRKELLDHPKSEFLKYLTWIWSLQNLVLAVCVYYRVHIYIEYNGMTRMRVVALYGILAVLVGFALVVWKVLKGNPILWLIRQDLWVLYLVVYFYFLTPVDVWVNRYNVQQILSGNPSPSVQIAVHPIRPSGLAELLPLLEAKDPVIRSGIQALLAQSFEDLSTHRVEQREGIWKFRQLSIRHAHNHLAQNQSQWSDMLNPDFRNQSLQGFKDYSHQWYD